jgi:signal transduction histidine kinase/CheY-like chemotaxis protein
VFSSSNSTLTAVPEQQQGFFLKQRYKPLTLCFDHAALLTTWCGDLNYYGLNGDILLNASATELLPLLIGIDVQKVTELPYVNLSDGHSADIHVIPNETGFCVFLVDSSRQKSGHEEIQQIANEVSLLNSKLKILTAELEQKNIALDKANQAKSEFIAGMSHEFRTPIVSILGHSAWLKKHLSKHTQWLKSLESIERSGTFLVTLINNLLQQGQNSVQHPLRIVRTPVNIPNFISSLLQIIQPLADEKNILLRSSPPPEKCDCCYLIDKNHLQQVLINLLANAVKFTRNGEVSLSVEYQIHQISFEVRDTGIGIPPDSLKDILIPFTRANNASAFQGAGLGLSIANRIITTMNGELQINSIENKGTKILIHLPAECASCVAIESAPEKPLAVSLHQGAVLLMEDNLDIVSIYSLFFKEAGINLNSVTDPSLFFDTVQSIAPEMIIIDYHLGETTGIDLVKEIRDSGFNGKIIMLTATSDINDRLQREALAAGCNQFMEKPSDVNSLINFVKSEIS